MDYYKAIKRGNYRDYVKHGNINSKTMKRGKKNKIPNYECRSEKL